MNGFGTHIRGAGDQRGANDRERKFHARKISPCRADILAARSDQVAV
jgi:hypothetical protein